MLPSLTIAARSRVSPKAFVVLAMGCVMLAGLALRTDDAGNAVTATPLPLARRLDPSSVALALPLAWLAAPLSGLNPDDRLDVVGVRPGDPASVYPLAADARVLIQDERALTVALRPDDAAQLSLARANGLLLVPLLRARR